MSAFLQQRPSRRVTRRGKARTIRARVAIVAAGIVALLFPMSAAAANSGSLDPTFGSGGYSTVSLGSLAEASAVVVQPDGMIVAAGEANVNGTNVIISTRMTSAGSLDPSYGTGGIVTVGIHGSAGVGSGAGLALQSDGKIVMGGEGRNGTGGPISFAAVRLLPNGSLDPSFGNGGVTTVPIGPEAIANAVVIQPDGKIVLGGTALVGHNEFAAVRLNADGTIDTSFGTNGVSTLSQDAAAWGLVLQPDGKLVLGGQTDYNTNQEFMAARLNPDGALDTTFGSGGIRMIPIGVTALGFGIALRPDGKFVLAGPAFTTTGVAATARLNPDGSLDPSYGSGGIATLPDWYGVNGIILDASGRIVLPLVGAGAVRLNPDGSADKTFGNGGIALAPLGSHGGANGAAIQPDGDIVLAGAAAVNGQTVLTVIRLVAGSAQSPVATGVPPIADGVAPSNTVGGAAKPPAISNVSVTTHRVRGREQSDTAITLSEPATINIVVTQTVRGRENSGRCRATAKNGARCMLTETKVNSIFHGTAGRNRFALRARSLRPGHYAGVITARDSSDATSKPLTFAFTVPRAPARQRSDR
jgi:uncharacterized delta-60 repeat protein